MRLIASFFTLLGLAATALAGAQLTDTLVGAAPNAEWTDMAPALGDVAADGQAQTTTQALVWPALFGEPEPPRPAAPLPPAPPVITAEPQPPTPPRPPLSSMGYQLKGVVRAGGSVWGLVSHPTGDTVMRVGDDMGEGMIISRIDGAGVWVETGTDKPELLGFPD
ncbi:MAG: hypothetical protein AAGE03_00280 [Pseudomonadota bacterium]